MRVLAGLLALLCFSGCGIPPVPQQEQIAQPVAEIKREESKAKPGGKWIVSQSASSFDDSPSVTIAVQSEVEVKGWPNLSERPLLVVRCQEGKTDVFIGTGMTGRILFGQYGQDLGTEMRMRYDNGEVFTYAMAGAENKKAYFVQDAVAEAKYMLNKRSLLVEFTPFNSNTQEFTFDLSGLGEIIAPLRKACSW